MNALAQLVTAPTPTVPPKFDSKQLLTLGANFDPLSGQMLAIFGFLGLLIAGVVVVAIGTGIIGTGRLAISGVSDNEHKTIAAFRGIKLSVASIGIALSFGALSFACMAVVAALMKLF